MRARILGSAAGGGIPQWNCECSNCAAVRRFSSEVEARTQDTVLVTTDDGKTAYLLNASPDIGAQIGKTRDLHPRSLRHTPIAAVVLTNAELEHSLGLLSLREGQAFSIYSTREVQSHLRERNAMFRALERFRRRVTWHVLDLEQSIELPLADGRSSGIELTPFPVDGKLPNYAEGIARPSLGDNVGLRLRQAGTTLVYASSVASLDGFARRADGADCLLFDGTFYSSDELGMLGIEGLSAEEMAHVPIGGERGSLQGLAGLSVKRRIYTHVNNTNPVLRRRSGAREAVRRAGWEVAFDGMEVVP
jgi:pyrroloquinoline quinone biosynthesis protein B